MSEELMIIKPDRIQDTLTKTDVMDALLAKADKLADEFEGSVARDVDRKAIATYARKFVSLKTTVENHRKENVKEKKDALKLYDAAGKRCRDHLDTLRDKVRQPLTEWESEQEKAENKIGELINFGRRYTGVEGVDALKAQLALAEAFDIFEIPADLMDRASVAQDETVATLKQSIVDATKRDADAKELAEHRAKKLADEAKTALETTKEQVDAGHVDIRQKAADLKEMTSGNEHPAFLDIPSESEFTDDVSNDSVAMENRMMKYPGLLLLCKDLYQELMGTPDSKWSLYTQRMEDAGLIQ